MTEKNTGPLVKLPKIQQEMINNCMFDSRCTFYLVRYGCFADILYIDENGFGWVRDLDDVKSIKFIKEIL